MTSLQKSEHGEYLGRTIVVWRPNLKERFLGLQLWCSLVEDVVVAFTHSCHLCSSYSDCTPCTTMAVVIFGVAMVLFILESGFYCFGKNAIQNRCVGEDAQGAICFKGVSAKV
jgi:hypothetical protein